MAEIKKTDNTMCWQGCRTIELFIYITGGNVNGKATLKHGQYLLKLNMHLLYEPAIQLLGKVQEKWVHMCSKDVQTCS